MLIYNSSDVRRVRVNDRHPEPLTPSWYGDSVGHYEGDTLVIDTVGDNFGNCPCCVLGVLDRLSRAGGLQRQSGQDIGKAVAAIGKGEHVHVHNLKTKRW